MRFKFYKKLLDIIKQFITPLIVAVGIFTYVILYFLLHLESIAQYVLFVIIFTGSLDLIRETFNSIIHKQFALDYIAILAISVGLLTGHILVAAVIVLMLSGGKTLEKYGMSQAKRSLSALIDRLPHHVVLAHGDSVGETVDISTVKVGQEIVVRKGEVLPMDGVLVSEMAEIDESTLTGEVNAVEKLQGDAIRSGTINVGQVLYLKITAIDADSSYRKIVSMVQQAQLEKAPFIRLADRYSTVFTIITVILAVLTYLFSRDMTRVLSILVIATPCPLILATPIALMGGVNASARKRIIVKNLAALEVLSRITTIIFDKTGTLTLGTPVVKELIRQHTTASEKEIYAIAAAIERNSLHPLAKALVLEAKKQQAPILHAHKVTEEIGKGISGIIDTVTYTLSKAHKSDGMEIVLMRDGKQIASFHFEDKLKADAKNILSTLRASHLGLHIFTGDKKVTTDALVQTLGSDVTVKAECSPEDKLKGIDELKKKGLITAMVGDGINDAPALAYADVGMVFSHHEYTAASEAADIVFLGGNFTAVLDAIHIAQRTIRIALQSIVFGIGLSVLGMIAAAFGFIPPVVGSILQEIIDVAVILNALRASR